MPAAAVAIFREPVLLPHPLTPAPTFTGPKSIMWPRSIQVNGLNMQGVTHHEAVSALRNAGSCIKMKVLRERLLSREVCGPEEPQDPPDVTSRQLCSLDGGGQRGKQPKTESAEDCLTKKIEAVVCNGNGIVGDLLKSQHKQRINVSMWIKKTVSQFYTLLFSLSLLSFCVSVWFGEWPEEDLV